MTERETIDFARQSTASRPARQTLVPPKKVKEAEAI